METVTQAMIVVAAGIVGFGLVSKRAQRGIVSPPMVFVLLGLLVHRLGWIDVGIGSEGIRLLAELTLILVLFTDASRIDLRLLVRDHNVPLRMLTIGLPLTIVAGAAVALGILPGLTFWEAAILAVILAPTDAALGQAVVSSPRVPVRIRQALNVESGLNDGVVLPLLLIVCALGTAAHGHPNTVGYWVGFVALQLLLGPLVGFAVGWGGGKLAGRAVRAGWMDETFLRLSALGLALLAYSGAEIVGGNGFIAAFCAGMALGNTARSLCGALYAFGETEGQLLSLLVFLAFGAVIVPEVLDHVSGPSVLYAILSLTLIRMIPVAVSLLGIKMRLETVAFLGWFGPRGLASVVFGLMILDTVDLAGEQTIVGTAMLTVLFSVVAHGITAMPMVKLYARRTTEMAEERMPEEHRAVKAMPVRVSHAD